MFFILKSKFFVFCGPRMAEHCFKCLLWFIGYQKPSKMNKGINVLFVPAAQTFLNNLAELDIRAAHQINPRPNAMFCDSTSRLRNFIISAMPVLGSIETACPVQLG